MSISRHGPQAWNPASAGSTSRRFAAPADDSSAETASEPLVLRRTACDVVASKPISESGVDEEFWARDIGVAEDDVLDVAHVIAGNATDVVRRHGFEPLHELRSPLPAAAPPLVRAEERSLRLVGLVLQVVASN